MRTLLIGILIFLPILALSTPVAAQAQDPEGVIKALETAANAQDLGAWVALFTDDAVIQVRPEDFGGTYTGQDEIRQYFEGLIADNFQISIDILDVQGDIVSTRTRISTDGLKQIGIASLEGTEQYTVQNGKITGFTFTYTLDSLTQLQAALAPPALPSTGARNVLSPLWLLLAGIALLAGLSVPLLLRHAR